MATQPPPTQRPSEPSVRWSRKKHLINSHSWHRKLGLSILLSNKTIFWNHRLQVSPTSVSRVSLTRAQTWNMRLAFCKSPSKKAQYEPMTIRQWPWLLKMNRATWSSRAQRWSAWCICATQIYSRSLSSRCLCNTSQSQVVMKTRYSEHHLLLGV